MSCDHEKGACWFPATNEDGWRCMDCGEALGFRPDLDEKLIDVKVSNLLMDLDEADLVHVSNGTMGQIISEGVARECRQEGLLDQGSILRKLIADPNFDSAEFWQKRRARRGPAASD